MGNISENGGLAKFRRLDGADKWLLLRAVAWLAIARARLVVTPFSRLFEQLTLEKEALIGPVDEVYLERVRYAVAAAANNVPWRSDCFPQTVAARMLLKRDGFASTIHFGVERVGDSDLAGHAWLTCGDFVVTGGSDLDRYVEIPHPGE